jgi:GNAT superfamily N-acetyltransferase
METIRAWAYGSTKEKIMPGTFIGRGVIRKLWVADLDAFRDHLLRLDMKSRHMRFQGAASDDTIAGYVKTTFVRSASVYGYFDAGILRAVAELHPLEGLLSTNAEAAFSVEPAYQEHGIGSELFKTLMTTARNRNIRNVILHCLPHNDRMRRLVRRFKGSVVFDGDELTGTIKVRAPTPLSFFREAITDSTGFAKAVLDAELALLKAS